MSTIRTWNTLTRSDIDGGILTAEQIINTQDVVISSEISGDFYQRTYYGITGSGVNGQNSSGPSGGQAPYLSSLICFPTATNYYGHTLDEKSLSTTITHKSDASGWSFSRCMHGYLDLYQYAYAKFCIGSYFEAPFPGQYFPFYAKKCCSIVHQWFIPTKDPVAENSPEYYGLTTPDPEYYSVQFYDKSGEKNELLSYRKDYAWRIVSCKYTVAGVEVAYTPGETIPAGFPPALPSKKLTMYTVGGVNTDEICLLKYPDDYPGVEDQTSCTIPDSITYTYQLYSKFSQIDEDDNIVAGSVSTSTATTVQDQTGSTISSSTVSTGGGSTTTTSTTTATSEGTTSDTVYADASSTTSNVVYVTTTTLTEFRDAGGGIVTSGGTVRAFSESLYIGSIHLSTDGSSCELIQVTEFDDTQSLAEGEYLYVYIFTEDNTKYPVLFCYITEVNKELTEKEQVIKYTCRDKKYYFGQLFTPAKYKYHPPTDDGTGTAYSMNTICKDVLAKSGLDFGNIALPSTVTCPPVEFSLDTVDSVIDWFIQYAGEYVCYQDRSGGINIVHSESSETTWEFKIPAKGTPVSDEYNVIEYHPVCDLSRSRSKVIITGDYPKKEVFSSQTYSILGTITDVRAASKTGLYYYQDTGLLMFVFVAENTPMSNLMSDTDKPGVYIEAQVDDSDNGTSTTAVNMDTSGNIITNNFTRVEKKYVNPSYIPDPDWVAENHYYFTYDDVVYVDEVLGYSLWQVAQSVVPTGTTYYYINCSISNFEYVGGVSVSKSTYDAYDGDNKRTYISSMFSEYCTFGFKKGTDAYNAYLKYKGITGVSVASTVSYSGNVVSRTYAFELDDFTQMSTQSTTNYDGYQIFYSPLYNYSTDAYGIFGTIKIWYAYEEDEPLMVSKITGYTGGTAIIKRPEFKKYTLVDGTSYSDESLMSTYLNLASPYYKPLYGGTLKLHGLYPHIQLLDKVNVTGTDLSADYTTGMIISGISFDMKEMTTTLELTENLFGKTDPVYSVAKDRSKETNEKLIKLGLIEKDTVYKFTSV